MASLPLTENQLDPPVAPAFISPVRKTTLSPSPAVFFTPPKRDPQSSPAPFQSPHSHSSTPRRYPPYTVQFGSGSKPLVSRSRVSPSPRKVVRCLESQFDGLDDNLSILVSTQPEFYIHDQYRHRSSSGSNYQYQISDTDETNTPGSKLAFIPHDRSWTTSDEFSPDGIAGFHTRSHDAQVSVTDEQFSSTLQGPDIPNTNHRRSFPITFEDLLSDESSTEIMEPSSSENTTINVSYLEPTLQQIPQSDLEGAGRGHHGSESLRKAEDFHRRSLLRRGMRTLVTNVLVGRERGKTAIRHWQQWRQRMLFEMVRISLTCQPHFQGEKLSLEVRLARETRYVYSPFW